MNTKIGFLVGIGFLITGCGNALNPAKLTLNTTTPSTLTTNATSCDSSQSIKPVTVSDWGSYQSGIFSACQSQAANGAGTTVTLNSPYTTGTQWCFVPAISNGVSRTYINVQGGINPVMVCGTVNAHSETITVPANIQFNSGYVFDTRDQAQMANCLAQQNRALCPRNYSFGNL